MGPCLMWRHVTDETVAKDVTKEKPRIDRRSRAQDGKPGGAELGVNVFWDGRDIT